MKTDIVYPQVGTSDRIKAQWERIAVRASILGVIAAPIVNWRTGGPLWSIVAIWVIFALNRLVISPEPVERGTVSIIVRAMLYAIVTMVLVEILLAPGWAETAIPLAALAALIASAVLTVIGLEKLQHLSMSMLELLFLSLIALPVFWLVKRPIHWPVIALSGTAGLILVLGLMHYRKEILQLIVKYLHTR